LQFHTSLDDYSILAKCARQLEQRVRPVETVGLYLHAWLGGSLALPVLLRGEDHDYAAALHLRVLFELGDVG
jgi:hypothetical protein